MNRDILNASGRLVFLCILGSVSIGTAVFVSPRIFHLPEGRSGCDTPIHWRLGTVDSRFPIGRKEFLVTAIMSEAVWEKQIGKDLFVYDPDATFVVTTAFDERQKMTYDTRNLEQKIDRYNETAESLKDTYDDRKAAFERDQKVLQRRIDAFQNDLADYNGDVSRANGNGGASPETYASLEKRRKALETEQSAIGKESDRLGKVADAVNSVAGKLNAETANVKRNLSEYRQKYGEPQPFVQGLYESPLTSITVYQFEGTEDLRLVLAHEFGHALGIEEHVPDDEGAIMYAMMGGQDLRNPALTEGDLAAYETACASRPESWRDTFVRYLVETPLRDMDAGAIFRSFSL